MSSIKFALRKCLKWQGMRVYEVITRIDKTVQSCQSMQKFKILQKVKITYWSAVVSIQSGNVKQRCFTFFLAAG